jgi:FMN-dependent NADH-azoreductase
VTRLLHTASSTRGAASESLAIAGPYRDAHPGAEIYEFDLWDGSLPEFAWPGITVVTAICFQPHLATADAETGRRAAHTAARDLGARF